MNLSAVPPHFRSFIATVCFLVPVLLLCLAPTPMSAEQPIVLRGAEQSAPVTPFVFEDDLRYVPQPREWRPGDPIKEIPRRTYPEPGGKLSPEYATGRDPLLDLQESSVVQRGVGDFTVPTRNFPGIGFTGVSPPDTVGDVGPDHYIQMVNSGGGAQVNIYDKAQPTPNLLTSFSLDTLGSGSCASGFGDPIVLYDRDADRWMLSEFSSSGNNLCVYVSQTADPVSGGWFNYGFVAPSFPDYPKYGVWATDSNSGGGSYVVTANDGGPGVYALDRGAMLTGQAATFQRFSISNLPGFSFEAPTPADTDGPVSPAPGTSAIIMRHRDTENHSGPPAPGDLLEMWEFDVDWINSANTTLTVAPSIDIAEIDSDLCGLTAFACFPQPGTGTTLDPLREVIMNRLQYMVRDDHESLVGSLVTDVNGNNLGGVRWFELRRSGGAGWVLHQEGTYSIDSDNRFMSSSAMDQSGNIAMAYNVTSSATFPSLRYTGRTADDPAGTMSAPETSIHAGTASSTTNRYGDYAAMNLDPTDDCTFWFTGENNTAGSWRTQIASFGFDACGCELEPLPPATQADPGGDNQIDISWDDSELDTVVEYLVQRSRSSGGPYETVAVVPDSTPGVPNGPGYFYADIGVSGDITYYYVVVASDGSACKSDPLNEASATGTGPCTLAPLFAGVESVGTAFDATCTMNLTWGQAAPECAGPVTYNVYRSQLPGFDPNPGDLLVGDLAATALTDINVLNSGTEYFYVVRSVDQSNGTEDGNQIELSGIPLGPLTTGTWLDDAGDTGQAKLTPEAPWSINGTEGNFGPNVYKTGNYGNNTCAGIVTPELLIGAGSQLSFWAKYEIEAGWDKGEVQVSTDGGASWERVPVNYPVNSIRASDACSLPPGDYFTGTNTNWEEYTADLSAWENQFVLMRWAMSTDGSVTANGWWVDDIQITQVDVPGDCATGSACEDNPFVNVAPEGPQTSCSGEIVLSAETTGGNGPFSYQWTKDGAPIAGATNNGYTPRSTGTHTYNCEVTAATCSDKVRDGIGSQLTLVDTPVFGGIVSAIDPQNQTCSVDLSWDAASTLCDGPIEYFVYRDVSSPVAPTPNNIVASGLSGTTWTDTAATVDGTTYNYLVRALDRSTLQLDGNVAEASATPTGPGTGLQIVLDEEFEDGASLAAWTRQNQPQNKTCGQWDRRNASAGRPGGSTGYYVSAYAVACGNPAVTTTLTSPVFDIPLSGLQSATLDLDLSYADGDSSDFGRLEVWDGSSWIELWSMSSGNVNSHFQFDVTAQANPAFQMRFTYSDSENYFSFDNLLIVADIVNVCDTVIGPAPAPDGRLGTSPLRADSLTSSGDSIQTSWDVSSCAAGQYNLLYGDLANVGSYTLLGSECSIGAGGGFTWNAVPPGDLFFLIVGTDGTGVESSWGVDGLFGERNGPAASGQCGVATKDTSDSCP